jgi:hypothetical protein
VHDAPESGERPIGKPSSVRLLLDFARDIGLADEETRQRHLDTKAGTLAGFVAVALSLEAGLGASVLTTDELGCAVRALFIFFFVVAVLGLAGAALSALLGVLAPQPYLGLREEILSGLATRAEMEVDEDVVRERQLATVVDIALYGRWTNDRKAKWLGWAARALAIAVVAIAAQGLTLPFA